jgi:DNA-binding transcriptional LysR family regulator
MDINNLKAFITVAETGSFSAASEQLYLTQPAVSKRIATLESELDTALFDRIGRQISLTEAGQALLPRARNILAELEDSRRAIRNLSGKVGGRLSLGTSHHIGLHRLPPVLSEYSQKYPDVELDLHFLASEEVCYQVVHGDIELGIVTLPKQPESPLRYKKVWDDPMDIMISASSPLVKRDDLSLDELLSQTAILPEPGTYTREIIEEAFEKINNPLPTGMSTNSLETVRMMVSIGLGWSVLPRTMIDRSLKVLRFPKLQFKRELGIIWHAGRTLSNAATTFFKTVK